MKRRCLLTAAPLFAMGMVCPRISRAASPLRVGAALPDPPFELMTGAGPSGFDVTLMQRVAALLGREW
jgi:ABC-type amino acid transport substrate-binding protein